MSGAPEIRRVDFNQLPKPVRERLAACLSGQGQPAPIIASRQSSTIFGWILLLLIAIGLAVALWVSELQAFQTGLPLPADAMASTVTLFFFFASVLGIARSPWAKKELPFPAGHYLLPCDVVDARSRTLRIVPTTLLSDLRIVHHLRNGAYQYTQLSFAVAGAGREIFVVYGKQQAEAQVEAFRQAQMGLAQAAQAQNWQAFWAADPFYELKRSGNWQAPPGPEQQQPPLVRPIPWVLRNRALLAGVAAVLIMPVWLGLRIVASDFVWFAGAERADSEYGWKWYIDHGYLHVDEAEERLPVAALREAKKKGTVSAIREVLKQYPRSKIEPEARAHLHSLYEGTLTAFRQKATGRDPAMLDFMGRLVAFLERQDVSTLRVVFKPPTAEALEKVDKQLASKTTKNGKAIAAIAPYFDEQHLVARESAIVTSLQNGFRQVFPTDLMQLQKGTAPAPNEPVLEIGYDVQPSGTIYTSDTDARAYVGIEVNFTMAMRIPGDSNSFGFTVQVQPPQRFSTSGSGDEVVYETMTRRAFDELDAKLEHVFFGTGAPGGAAATLGGSK
jgi:hypothetical protein